MPPSKFTTGLEKVKWLPWHQDKVGAVKAGLAFICLQDTHPQEPKGCTAQGWQVGSAASQIL